MGLDGKVALVTGGSRGIGAAVARRLAREGAAVALTYVSNADKAEAVAKEIEADGGRALVIHADNADTRAVVGAVEQTVRELGGLDVLVNNAGIHVSGPLEETPVEQLDRILAVDVRAVFLASQAAARHLGDGGRIITIGSAVADHMPVAGMTLYTMAKSALVGLTKGLARDLGPRGITVTVVHPGLIDTDMNPAAEINYAHDQRHGKVAAHFRARASPADDHDQVQSGAPPDEPTPRPVTAAGPRSRAPNHR